MVTLLLVIIYIAFIGLGLPHSIFGAAWPAISSDLSLTIDSANYVTILISGSTVISSMFGARIAKRIGTGNVAFIGALVAAISLLGFSFSEGLWLMCIFAIPLGLAAGVCDASLNNYIALNYSAMHMNFLHCFFGAGVMLSPYIMSAMIEKFSWRTGYRSVFLLQSVITLILLLSLPMWKSKKIQTGETKDNEITKQKSSSYISLAKRKDVLLNWLMCISANAIEGVVGLWASTYLVFVHNTGEAKAAAGVMFFYIGLAFGRFVAGLLSKKLSGGKLLKIGTMVMSLGILLMFIPSISVAIGALFLIGFGNGPLHPNILHLTPRCFGEELSDCVMGTQMAAAYFGIMAAPPIFGLLVKYIGAAVFGWYLGIWVVLFLISTVLFSKKNKGIFQ